MLSAPPRGMNSRGEVACGKMTVEQNGSRARTILVVAVGSSKSDWLEKFPPNMGATAESLVVPHINA